MMDGEEARIVWDLRSGEVSGPLELPDEHFCAYCERETTGNYGTTRTAGLEADVFACDECSRLTHADCEGR